MEISPPRMVSSSRSGRERISRPAIRTDPRTAYRSAGSSLSNARASVVFPHPDSPNSPTTLPASTRKETPARIGTWWGTPFRLSAVAGRSVYRSTLTFSTASPAGIPPILAQFHGARVVLRIRLGSVGSSTRDVRGMYIARTASPGTGSRSSCKPLILFERSFGVPSVLPWGMSNTWECHLERWTASGVVDAGIRDRILAWEREHPEPQGLRWPVLIALAFGGILLGAGVLLFVSAHWDQLSAAQRMSLVVAMVAVFHLGGAVSAGRFGGLSVTLHTLGTVALGGAIALTGQIFNLSDHWPAAFLLWAAGAALAWTLLGHWTQAALTSMLIPYWLAGEWWTVAEQHRLSILPISVGVCALSFTYLSARRGPDDSALRKALGWLGGMALLPAAIAVALAPWESSSYGWQPQAIA